MAAKASKGGGASKYMLLLGVLFVVGAILWWLGTPGVIDAPFLVQVGYAICSNYPILLAIAIAIGLARESQGAAGLAALLGYEVIVNGAQAIQPHIDVSPNLHHSYFVLVAGIIAGAAGGVMYNRFYNIKLPSWLAFFGGRRFVPIVTAFVCLFFAIVLGSTWHV